MLKSTLVEPLIIKQGLDSNKRLGVLSASPERLKSLGEFHRLRTGSPESYSRPSGSVSISSAPRRARLPTVHPLFQFAPTLFFHSAPIAFFPVHPIVVLPVHPIVLFHFGPIAIPAYGVFAAIAVLVALFLSVRMAGVLKVDANPVWNLGVLMVFSTLVASRLLIVLLHWSDFRSAPLWMVSLAAIYTPWPLLGGCALGLLTGLAYALIVKLPLRRTLDVLAPPLALGHAIACMGSFAVGSAYGSRTQVPWAVVYHSRLAAMWSRTPQGVPLHPTQLYECVMELAIFILLLAFLRRLEAGEVMGAWLFLMGLGKYFLEFLRGRGQGELLNGALTLGQGLAVAMVVAGGMLWWKRDTVGVSAYLT